MLYVCIIQVEYNPLKDEQGQIVRWYATATNIDDLKRTEQQLRKDEREMRAITDAIPQYIVVLGPDGRVIYRWPGNIRELQNVVERAVILSEGNAFTVEESWLKQDAADAATRDKPVSALTAREIETIEAALTESSGRIAGPSGAAAKLGIPRQTLESKIRRLGIDNRGRKA